MLRSRRACLKGIGTGETYMKVPPVVDRVGSCWRSGTYVAAAALAAASSAEGRNDFVSSAEVCEDLRSEAAAIAAAAVAQAVATPVPQQPDRSVADPVRPMVSAPPAAGVPALPPTQYVRVRSNSNPAKVARYVLNNIGPAQQSGLGPDLSQGLHCPVVLSTKGNKATYLALKAVLLARLFDPQRNVVVQPRLRRVRNVAATPDLGHEGTATASGTRAIEQALDTEPAIGQTASYDMELWLRTGTLRPADVAAGEAEAAPRDLAVSGRRPPGSTDTRRNMDAKIAQAITKALSQGAPLRLHTMGSAAAMRALRALSSVRYQLLGDNQDDVELLLWSGDELPQWGNLEGESGRAKEEGTLDGGKQAPVGDSSSEVDGVDRAAWAAGPGAATAQAQAPVKELVMEVRRCVARPSAVRKLQGVAKGLPRRLALSAKPVPGGNRSAGHGAPVTSGATLGSSEGDNLVLVPASQLQALQEQLMQLSEQQKSLLGLVKQHSQQQKQ